MLTTILFDLDDTLAPEEAFAAEALSPACEMAAKRHGVDPAALYRSLRHRARELWHASPTYQYCSAMGIGSWDGLWSAFRGDGPHLAALRAWAPDYRRAAWTAALTDCGVADTYLAAELANVSAGRECFHPRLLFDDTLPALQYLAPDYKLGLVTNGPSDLQRAKLRGTGLKKYFDAVAISGDIGAGKPDPAVFRRALELLGAGPGEAIMIGDLLERDVLGAQSAGIAGWWLNRDGRKRDGTIRPDQELGRLRDLESRLLKEESR